MADQKLDPEALEQVNALEISDELKEFVQTLDGDIEEARTDRAEWETRQDIYTKKRYGIRTPKTHPWVGAANFVLPQIDSDINRLKPAYINLAFGVSPIVNFEPYGSEDIEPAKKREVLFDWRMKTQVRFFKDYCLGVDFALHRGYTLFKTTWKFQTRKYTKYLDLSEIETEIVDAMFMPEVTDDILFHILAEAIKPDLTFQENVDAINDAIAEFREGKTRFEMEFVEKSENRAEVRACDPREDVVFPIGTTDIQQAHFIDYKFWASKNDIKMAMRAEKYEEYDDYEISSWSTKSYEMTAADTIKATRDGVVFHKRQDEAVLLHEVCTWYDVNGDGIDERVIITYPDSDPSAILRFIEVPYDHGLFPYAVVRRELNDDEIMSSRGIPALGDDFQTGISTLLNQDIDAGTIATTPTVVARKNSVKNLRNNLRYVPGNYVETENGVGDYGIVQQPNVGQVNRFNQMQYLKGWANDRIGNPTAQVSQITNAPGQGQQGQKTAREIDAMSFASGQLQSMDLLVWQMQMADVYYQVDMLYEQFGDEEEEVLITGEQPLKISRQEIQGKFNRVPNGRVDNSNPVIRMNKALSMFQLFRNDPDVKQSDLKKYVMDEIDVRLSKKLLLTAEEKQALAMQAQIAQAQGIKQQLALKQISDGLEVRKEAALAQVQGRKYAKE